MADRVLTLAFDHGDLEELNALVREAIRQPQRTLRAEVRDGQSWWRLGTAAWVGPLGREVQS